MGELTTIGLDIAKSVFQVHGIDAKGEVVLRQRLTRCRLLPFFAKLPRCLIGIEACATAHHWARELLALGHDVRLMPPAYVKPYVKRQKNDAADAEAICEAVGRPTMRFVEPKTIEQQSILMLHRVRLMLTRQRTQLGNAVRAHMAEPGIVAPIGRKGLASLLAVIADASDTRLPATTRVCLSMLAAQLQLLDAQILENDRAIRETARSSETGRRLMEIPGVARCSPAPSSPACRIRTCSSRAATSPPGSVWCPSRTRAAARSGSAASASRATATCASCWSSARLPSSAMPSATARGGRGSSS